MDLRQLAVCSMLAASVLSHGVILAKDPPPPPATPPATPPAEGARSGKETDPLVQLVRSLTPEQKTRLIESIKTWQELTPEVKQALRAREKNLKKTLLEEMEAALAGANFTQEQKDLFEKRFKEERRKLEATLRAEIEARRKAGVQEISERVKTEVSATAPAATPPNTPEKPAPQEK